MEKKYKREKINIENQQHDRQVWNEVDKVDNIVRHNTNEHNGTSIINWNNFGKLKRFDFLQTIENFISRYDRSLKDDTDIENWLKDYTMNIIISILISMMQLATLFE